METPEKRPEQFNQRRLTFTLYPEIRSGQFKQFPGKKRIPASSENNRRIAERSQFFNHGDEIVCEHPTIRNPYIIYVSLRNPDDLRFKYAHDGFQVRLRIEHVENLYFIRSPDKRGRNMTYA